MGAGPLEARQDFFPFGDLFFNFPVYIRERRAETAQNIHESGKPGALGDGNVIHRGKR